ncbi:MAG: diacylglycerol kinase [Alphaproteobacteria bacterium]|jgi:diacylglycerol kinase (ATP)|nr:diacylglycerol kinase [Alphaproteobacteria bacterium]MBT5390595.1 diacylglycerol kinase [Alphaproteobacteria bacterium]MBT5540653.1 diacylglycerol kinase [Alphaproteobacteria bacterium]MBT5654356.1 diacylglycerol kinase [Alphaproteobacteria bacterium]
MKSLYNATRYALAGIGYAWQNEASFQREVILFFLALPTAYFISTSTFDFTLLIGSILMIMVVELLNTGLENVVDLIGGGKSVLSKGAKDCGAAAVFITILLAALLWIDKFIAYFS